MTKKHAKLPRMQRVLTLKAPNTTIAEFANTADPDELSHLDLQCLLSKVLFFQHKTVSIKSFLKFFRRNFVVCFLDVLRLKRCLTCLVLVHS